MKLKFGLSKLRFRKLRELLKVTLGFHTINKSGKVRYGNNILRYAFVPRYTTLPEFCLSTLPSTYKVDCAKVGYTLDAIIDNSYSNFILGKYDISITGANFKFNTLRNLFKNGFRSDDYMVNHYANRLSLPVLKLLKNRFGDLDFANLIVPMPTKIVVRVRSIEKGIMDYVRSQFDLMRAGPSFQSKMELVA